MYTQAQVDQFKVQYGAQNRGTKDGIDWWRMSDGRWLAVRKATAVLFEVRVLPANACSC